MPQWNSTWIVFREWTGLGQMKTYMGDISRRGSRREKGLVVNDIWRQLQSTNIWLGFSFTRKPQIQISLGDQSCKNTCRSKGVFIKAFLKCLLRTNDVAGIVQSSRDIMLITAAINLKFLQAYILVVERAVYFIVSHIVNKVVAEKDRAWLAYAVRETGA